MAKQPPLDANQNPFGFSETPFDPITGQRYPLDAFAQPTFREFLVYQEHHNHLLCKTFETRDIDDDIFYYIAKPFNLRTIIPKDEDGEWVEESEEPYEFNDVEYTYYRDYPNKRLAQDPDSNYFDEIQYITPDYYEGEVITAVRMNTGVLRELYDGDGDLMVERRILEWMDINTAGRQWAVTILSMEVS